jgi:hypothetical protein
MLNRQIRRKGLLGSVALAPCAEAKSYDKGRVVKMSILDWSEFPAVESVPDRRSGEWVFRDARTRVAMFLKTLRRDRE